MSSESAARLTDAARRLRGARLVDLLERDPARVAALSFAFEDWRVDLSRERIDAEALAALVSVAHDQNLPNWIAALFAGERINLSEGRAVLHAALRRDESAPLVVDGADVRAQARSAQAAMLALADNLRASRRSGGGGRPIAHIVHLGIGGSDLGPRLVCDALRDSTATTPHVHFVSNVDPEHLARTLATLDPATTLFIVASKSFTTEETLANAQSARRWLSGALPESSLAAHFVAVTSNASAARAFGIAAADIFALPDGIGGRCSLWTFGMLPIAIALGAQAVSALADGARAMDRHFASAPLAENVPVILALLDVWNTRWLRHSQRVVVPYAAALASLPLYLQQLALESNGKSAQRDGTPVEGATAKALWGSVGTDSQHAFFQWLHQGTSEVPVEFIVPVRARHPLGDQQATLVANALAQAQALLIGRGDDAIRDDLAQRGLAGPALDAAIAARRCTGNRASTTLLLPTLDARTLGALIALYEHRTFVEGVMYGINSFDQWGVELGKTLAGPLAAALVNGDPLPEGTDASTRALVEHARTLAGKAS
jgi:glucose-6-phosphate isomerase